MTRKLLDHRVQAMKDFVRRIVQEEYEGNATAAARGMKMPQSQISDLFNDRRGLGLIGLERVADYAGVSLDEVVGRKVPRGKPANRRDLAADLAREDGVAESAIQTVLAEEIDPKDAARSALWWARRMRLKEVEMETGELPTTTIRRKRA